MSNNTFLKALRVVIPYFGLVWGLVACVHNATSAHKAQSEYIDDYALFSGVVHSLDDSSGNIPLRVDPHPIRTDTISRDIEKIDMFVRPARMQLVPDVVMGRRSVLHKLKILETDDPTRGKCPGALLPSPPDGSPNPKDKFCPKESIMLAAIGLPRLSEKSGEQRLVRAIVTTLTPAGAATDVYDFVFRLEAGKFEQVEKRYLMTID